MRRRRAFVAGAIIGANVAARREYRREVRRACRIGCTCYICVPCVRYTSPRFQIFPKLNILLKILKFVIWNLSQRGPCSCVQCGTGNTVTRQTSVTYVQTGYVPPPPPQNNTINYYQQPPRNQPGSYGAPPNSGYGQPPPGPDYQAPPPAYQNCPPPTAPPSYGPPPSGPPGNGYQPYPNPPTYPNQPYPPQ